MDDHRDTSVDRREFLRRTGALGIAGASALGFPLLETRAAGAAPLLPPRDVIAAGGGATIKIGHLDGFSGVYAAASQSQQHGMEVAVADTASPTAELRQPVRTSTFSCEIRRFASVVPVAGLLASSPLTSSYLMRLFFFIASATATSMPWCCDCDAAA